jgi:hypothetical protein
MLEKGSFSWRSCNERIIENPFLVWRPMKGPSDVGTSSAEGPSGMGTQADLVEVVHTLMLAVCVKE